MILDVTGFSFSGKSVLHDLLSQSGEVDFVDREFEFDLIRCPGGCISKRKLVACAL